jgi:prephenate dehydrogenase
MPSPKADPQAVETAVNLGTVLGAKPFFVDAAEYDSLVQGVEAAPGLLAAALFRAVTEATGWRDILRFANLRFAQATLPLRDGETVAMLALQDRQAMLRWLDAVLAQLQEMRQWVAEGDEVRMVALLQQLDENREKWLRDRAENKWEEGSNLDFEPPSMLQQLLGRRGGSDA